MPDPGSGKPSPGPSSQPGSSPAGRPRSTGEGQAVKIARLALAAGGTVTLALMGLVPPLYALGALVAIAVPTSAREIVQVFRGGDR